MKKENPGELAAKALSDLNTFAVIVSILEGGHIMFSKSSADEQIIAICRDEQQKLLRHYDRLLAEAAQQDTKP